MLALRRASCVVLLGAALGCARIVAVGREDALALAGDGAGGAASSTGASAGAGSVDGGASSGAAGGDGALDGLLWSAEHETGAFDEWLSDGAGVQYEARTGQLAITSERAHTGSRAFTASIDTRDGELHQAMMGRHIELLEGRYGAWYFLPQAPRADYWVIMKLSNAGSDRFDIDIEARSGDYAHLRLFEHPNMWITEPASVAFPVGRWVHVEALYRSTAANDGRLVILQDGEPVLDTGARSTADDDRVTFFCGNTSRSVTPAPFELFIDDVSISTSTGW